MSLERRNRHSESSSPDAVLATTSLAATACLETPGVMASTATSLDLATCVIVPTAASIMVVFPAPTAPTIAMDTGMDSRVSISASQYGQTVTRSPLLPWVQGRSCPLLHVWTLYPYSLGTG